MVVGEGDKGTARGEQSVNIYDLERLRQYLRTSRGTAYHIETVRRYRMGSFRLFTPLLIVTDGVNSISFRIDSDPERVLEMLIEIQEEIKKEQTRKAGSHE